MMSKRLYKQKVLLIEKEKVLGILVLIQRTLQNKSLNK